MVAWQAWREAQARLDCLRLLFGGRAGDPFSPGEATRLLKAKFAARGGPVLGVEADEAAPPAAGRAAFALALVAADQLPGRGTVDVRLHRNGALSVTAAGAIRQNSSELEAVLAGGPTGSSALAPAAYAVRLVGPVAFETLAGKMVFSARGS
jgi:hypothetical protein